MWQRLANVTMHNAKRYAVLLFLSSLLCLTIEVTAARALGTRVSAMQMALVRSMGAALVFLPLVIQSGGGAYRTTQLPLHLVRGALSVSGLWCYFMVFASLPLAEATTLSYSQVFFLTILATVVLGETVTFVRWFATLIGLIGVALVMRPAFEGSQAAYFVALVSAFLSALLYAVTKMLTAKDAPQTVMIYVATMTLGAYAVPGLLAWKHPSAEEAALLLVIASFGPVGQYLGIRAFELADASFLAPFDYLRLVFAGLIGFLLFGELPDFWAIVGATVIIVGALLISLGTDATAPIRNVGERAS
jgi:drug/metabolite transporter (DMT)-like permease